MAIREAAEEEPNKSSAADETSSQLNFIDDSGERVVPATSHHGLSLLTAAVFIVGEMAGSGILALPRAVADAGWAGLFLICFCCMNAAYASICLARCWLIIEDRYPDCRSKCRNPYSVIGIKSVGPWMRYVVSFNVNFQLFGAAVVFLLLCAELMSSVFKEVIDLSFCYWILIFGAILGPLTLFGSPQDFWPAAFGATGCTIIGSVLVVVLVFLDAGAKYPVAEYPSPSFKSFFLAFGTILFAFGGACTFPTFQNDMRDKSKFPLAVVFGFIMMLGLYLPVSLGGYLVYGDQVNANVLLSVETGVLQKIVNVMMALHLFCAFLIVINPVNLDFENYLNVPNSFNLKRCILRFIVLIIVIFIGETIPKFGKILNLVGGSSVTLMTFVLPPWFYIKLCQQQSSDSPANKISIYTKSYLIFIGIVGIVGGIAATYSALSDLVAPHAFTPPCYINSCQTVQ